MAGFIYKDQSTKRIISVPLEIGLLNRPDRHTGLKREKIQGESTITRPIPNEYGTRNAETIQLEFCLWKSDGTPFTAKEQRKINAWLTSPKYSDFIEFEKYDGEKVLYQGIFTDASAGEYASGNMELAFTFEANSPYCWEYVEHDFSIFGSDTLIFDCDSDELEEYVYPTLIITEPSETAEITIENITDEGNIFRVRALDRVPMKFDCKNCIVSDDTTSGIISYTDLGWDDVGSIYWPRLVPGENIWEVTGNVDITLSYYCPHKRLGGWI